MKLLAPLAFIFLTSSGFAAGPDFARDVLPILQRTCFECHGAEKQKGGLRMDSKAELMKGGDSGPVLTESKDHASELLRRVTLPKDDDEIMPPRGEPLSKSQVSTLQAWLNAGADWPEGVKAGPHWSFVPPVQVKRPGEAGQHPVDAFIRASLKQAGLQSTAPASAEILARRLHLDLTGLPPTPAAVAAFRTAFAQDADAAVAALADTLLASEHYGEKWARPWLDAARYADSHGFQRDELWPLWPYRDWVIRALNADMPFDQFTIEQLAGDLLPAATPEQIIATGFMRCSPCNIESGTDPEESRVSQVLDRVNTVGMVWLGLTLECAQCHDHKYDPISQRDYYGLLAFFNSTQTEVVREKEGSAKLKFLGPFAEVKAEALAAERAPLNTQLLDLQARIRVMKANRTEPFDGSQDEVALTAKAATGSPEALARVEEARVRSLLAQMGEPRSLIMSELPGGRESFIFQRGDFRSPGDAVQPATPAVLPKMTSDEKPTRLTLARWLVSREHPLTARVMVNRLWQEIFGEGLVTTPEDFGIKGDAPSHPDLLDWLAVEFMQRGWSQKQLLRLIVTSHTYRQSSDATDLLLERDPRNRLLARGPRFRLDAEGIRDNALAIAGVLSPKLYGPPVRPPQPEGVWRKVGGQNLTYQPSSGEDANRRGLYTLLRRTSPYPSLVTFDATARTVCRVKRTRSNTPLQALTLLNDPVYVQAARSLAQRVMQEMPDAPLDEQLRHAFTLTLARPPAAAELALLRQLHESESTATRDATTALTAVTATLLNLDETITKN